MREELPAGTLEAYFENYNSQFLTPFTFRLDFKDGFSTDYNTDIRWQLTCKDVISAQVSLSNHELKEGDELELNFTFKSYFVGEILLILNENSLKFNYLDVHFRNSGLQL